MLSKEFCIGGSKDPDETVRPTADELEEIRKTCEELGAEYFARPRKAVETTLDQPTN